jgi:membrane associated rhomboid family serine protease
MARRPAAPFALYVLVALNVAVFLAWQVLGPSALMRAHFLVSADALLAGRVWTLLTSALSHADLGHLLFNLLALWLFGRIVEQIVGPAGFVGLYVVGGVVASVGHVAWGLLTGDPSPALGASGSVMAVAVTFAVLFPTQRLYLFLMVPMPAWFAVLLYVGLDLFGLFDARSTIAHAAHLGGAVTGLAYGLLWARPRLQRLYRR